MAKPKFWLKIDNGTISIFEGNRPGKIIGSTEGYETRLLAAAAKLKLINDAKKANKPVQQQVNQKRGAGSPNPDKGKNKKGKKD